MGLILKNSLRLITIIATIILTSCIGNEERKIFVQDYENVLDSLQEARLNTLYLDHETKTTNQIALLTTHGFEPDSTIKDFSLRKFRTLGIGQKDKNNGVLIVFSLTMRQVRIATGYGTEKVLTDSIAKRIIDSMMTPHFKKQEYFEGLWNGSVAITTFLERPENKITAANKRFGVMSAD